MKLWKLWLACLLVVPGLALPDSVELRNGSVFEGDILIETKTFIVMKIGGTGQMRIDRNKIKSLKRTRAYKAEPAAPKVEPAAAQPAANPAAKTKEKIKPDPNWRYAHASRYVDTSNPDLNQLIKKISKPGKEKADDVIALRKYKKKASPAIPQLLRIMADERVVSATNTNFRWIGYGALNGQSGFTCQDVILAKEAAYTLAKIGEPALYPTLDVLEDKNPIRRTYAAMSLSWNSAAGSKQHYWNVYKALTARFKDPHPRPRGQAVSTLAYVGPQEVVNELVPFLMDPDEFVRREARSGIDHRKNFKDLRIDHLLSGLRSGRASERRRAAQALLYLARRLAGNAKLEAALRYALDDGDADVRKYAALGLGKLPGKRNAFSLIHNTDDKDEDVRVSAIKGLRGTREPAGIEKLIAALRDPSPKVRKEAARSLRKTDSRYAAAALIETLKDADGDVARQAASTLGTTGDLSALTPLFELLITDKRSHKAVEGAFSGLARKSDDHKKKTALFLMGKLTHSDRDIRYRAVRALFNVRTPITVNALGRATRDADLWIRMAATEALGLTRLKETVPHLIRVLDDPEEKVRKKAHAMLRLVTKNWDLSDRSGDWTAWWHTQP